MMSKLFVIMIFAALILSACAPPTIQANDSVNIGQGANVEQGQAADMITLSGGETVLIVCDTGEPMTGSFVYERVALSCPIPGVTPIPPTIVPPTFAAPTETPASQEHDVTAWHAFNGDHHHGDEPAGGLNAFFVENTGQEIGYPWVSSPTENLYPYPTGKHDGFMLIHENLETCEQYETSGNCITEFLLELHTRGNVGAILTRFHSDAGAFRVCSPDLSQCGLIFTGGITDYGVTHNPYKNDLCPLPSDPPNFPYGLEGGTNQFQPPYRSEMRNGSQFWSSLGPPGNSFWRDVYPDSPNNILRIAWATNDPIDLMPDDPDLCADPTNATPAGGDNSNVQVFSIYLNNLPTERPFSGFTDVNGEIDESCTEASRECVPLVITESVPQGGVAMNRQVRPGRCDIAPCHEFGK